MAKTDKHGLTKAEEQFLVNRLVRGWTLQRCYKKFNPGTKQTDTLRYAGYKTLERIKEKTGSWAERYEIAGQGPDRIGKIIEAALKANKADKADHHTRLRAADFLKDIFGLSEQKVTVRIDKPLPLIVVTSDDDIPADD